MSSHCLLLQITRCVIQEYHPDLAFIMLWTTCMTIQEICYCGIVYVTVDSVENNPWDHVRRNTTLHMSWANLRRIVQRNAIPLNLYSVQSVTFLLVKIYRGNMDETV